MLVYLSEADALAAIERLYETVDHLSHIKPYAFPRTEHPAKDEIAIALDAVRDGRLDAAEALLVEAMHKLELRQAELTSRGIDFKW